VVVDLFSGVDFDFGEVGDVMVYVDVMVIFGMVKFVLLLLFVVEYFDLV